MNEDILDAEGVTCKLVVSSCFIAATVDDEDCMPENGDVSSI